MTRWKDLEPEQVKDLINPDRLRPEQITAICDTREQKPLNLQPLRTVTETLTTGDYSVRGLQHLICVERKSLSDFLHCCVGHSRQRFERCIQRMLGIPHKLIVVETTMDEIRAGNWRPRISPKSVEGTLLRWTCEGVPILPTGSHENTGITVSRFLFLAAKARIRELQPFWKEPSHASNGRP